MSASKLCFIATQLFAIATIIISGMMGTPPAPVVPMADGFQTPILALEFARTAEDLAFLQGEAAAPLRDALMHTQDLDRYFPLAYAGMAAVFFGALWATGRRLALIGVVLAILTIPADWWENQWVNIILAGMTNATVEQITLEPPAGQVESDAEPASFLAGPGDGAGLVVALALEKIHFTTWIKWGLIGAYALMMAVLMWQEKRRILAIPGALAAIALLATFLSGSNGHVAEIMGLTMLPFMLSFPIAAGMSLRPSRET